MSRTLSQLVSTMPPPQARRISGSFIHQSAWKGYSANIVQTAFQNFEEMAEGSLAYREGMREARPWGIMCAMEKR
jgi:hypothetical protein